MIVALRMALRIDAPSKVFMMAAGLRREASLAGSKAGALGAISGASSAPRAARRSDGFLGAAGRWLVDSDTLASGASDVCLLRPADVSSSSKSILRAASSA